MSLSVTIPADKNPTDLADAQLYVRGTGMTIDTEQGFAVAGFVGYTSKEAKEAGKQHVYQFQGLQVGPIPQPPQYDPQTGAKIADARPSLPQLLDASVFGVEFNKVATILYCLAQEYDPQLKAASLNEAEFDADYLAEVRSKIATLKAAQ